MGRRHEGHHDEIEPIGDEHEMQTAVWREEKARRRAQRAEREAALAASGLDVRIREAAEAALADLPRIQRHLEEIRDRLAATPSEEAEAHLGYLIGTAAAFGSRVEGLHLCLGREAGRRAANARGNDQ